MSSAFEIAAIGLSSQQVALDTIAGNIANINTPAFKRSEVSFSELLSGVSPAAMASAQLAPQGRSAGAMVRAVPQLDRQGQIEQTGQALDIAIDGQGYIELLGPDGRTLLWRGGTLSLTEEGFLAGGNGLMLKALVQVPRDATSLEITPEGRVIAGEGAAASVIGQISLVRPEGSGDLIRLEGGLYEAGNPRFLRDYVPGEEGAGFLVQGAMERSNVDLNEEMVRMMIVQRAYTANAKVVQAADELMSIANNLRRG